MTTFTRAAPGRATPDPAKHVNYTYGMVLGVDDFVQEFAYLEGRSREMARDLCGYGTVYGLRVGYEATYPGTDRGPRLTVSVGLAVPPSGRPVQVTSNQCGYLVEWLAAHRDEVVAALGGPPPASGQLDLAVVLSAADCATDPVPIPGEPCRSEDELMEPSRLRDDFLLELRLPAPEPPAEERAVRGFIAWLRAVPVVPGSSSTMDELTAAIRTAAAAADYFGTAPPAGLTIPAEQAGEYRRAALRLWAVEVLPAWRLPPSAPLPPPVPPVPPTLDPDSLPLARIRLDVLYDSVTDRLLVGPAGAQVDDSDRPYLVDLRLLQELALGSQPTAAGGSVVAAGWLDPAGAVPGPPFFSRGGLAATARAPDLFDLSFDGFDPAGHYLVSGHAVVAEATGQHLLEVVEPGPGAQLTVRVRAIAGATSPQGFQVQITRYGP